VNAEGWRFTILVDVGYLDAPIGLDPLAQSLQARLAAIASGQK
jgi:hypothetical protein